MTYVLEDFLCLLGGAWSVGEQKGSRDTSQVAFVGIQVRDNGALDLGSRDGSGKKKARSRRHLEGR